MRRRTTRLYGGYAQILCVVLASYRIWAKERQQVFDANTQIRTLTIQLDQRQRRTEIRTALGNYLLEGRPLLVRCADESQPPPNQATDAWAQRAEMYMHENMDDSFIAHFRDGAGLPMTANSIASIPHRQLWADIWVRIARLQEFIKVFGN
jgi:hypothetical protein